MRVHSIHLRNYRGVTDAGVEFSDGVTIVEGPNEVGKSSIHEAITHLREDKMTSKKASIRNTQPIGVDEGPEVELHLTTGDHEVRYAKRWLRNPFTTLQILRPAPAQLTGDDAHDRFAAILDETVDVDLLVALDVAQGESLDQAALAQISALQSALGDSGVEIAEHDDFLDRVEKEFEKYFTSPGRKSKDFRDAIAAVFAAQEALRELEDRSADLDRLVDRHARATSRLETVREELAAAGVEREEAETAFATVDDLDAALTAEVTGAQSVQRELTLAEEALERRSALIGDVETAEKVSTRAAETASARESAQEETAAAFAQAHDTHAVTRTALDEAREEVKRLSRSIARARARGERETLARRLADIKVQEEKRDAAKATAGSIAVTTKDVEKLRGLEADLRIAEGAKTSAAAQLSVTRLGTTPITVDGTAVETGERGDFAVVDEMAITVEGVADIVIRPGVSPTDLDDAVVTAGKRLDAELGRLGIESVSQARDQADRRIAAEAVIAEATATLTALLGEDERDDLESSLARADALLADTKGEEGEDDGAARASAAGEASLSSLEELLRKAEKSVDAAQRAFDEATAALERARGARDEARVETVRAQTSLEDAQAQAERLKKALDEARAATPDADLEAALAAVRERAEQASERVADARAAYEQANPEALGDRLENARRLVVSKEAEREKCRQEVDQLTGAIDDRVSEGIFEKRDAAEEALETATARLRRMERSARAIELLRSTVLAHKEEVQRKYVAPFTEQIERLGRLVFGPDFSVEVADDLSIVSRTLHGTTVPFASLSGGTREQLSLIGRLAVAALVDRESGAPVILDDAFGFADPERLTALNVILGKVGESAQVVLLTCQPDRFAKVGGATTVSLG